MTTHAQNTPTQIVRDSDNAEASDLEKRIGEFSDSADSWQNAHLLIVFITVIAAAAAFGTQYWSNKQQKVLSSLQAQLNLVKDRQLLEKDRQLAADLKAKDLAIADANSKASTAEERAGRANEQAAQAEGRAAKAVRQAAEANLLARQYEASIADANARSAEAEKLTVEARLELAKFRAPRRLTPEQQARITNRIRRFTGQVYTLSVAPGAEPLGLLRDLDTVLQAAAWTWQKHNSKIQVSEKWGITLTDGVKIQFAPSRESILAPIVLALANAIHAEGIEGVSAERVVAYEETLPSVIHILIGTKP